MLTKLENLAPSFDTVLIYRIATRLFKFVTISNRNNGSQALSAISSFYTKKIRKDILDDFFFVWRQLH